MPESRGGERTGDRQTHRSLRAGAKALVKYRKDIRPDHPRFAKTKIDIADITVLEGKTQLSQAMAQEGETRTAGLLLAG